MKIIKSAAVIGAGTMGASIAAHLANAGVRVLLLDIIPGDLRPREVERGLSLDDRVVRNRLAEEGYQAAVKSRPASFFTHDLSTLVEIGHLVDDFDRLGDVDWIIEAIIENLSIKQDLMARIDQIRAESTIVSTNTSGIPVAKIAEETSKEFRAHFLGTHFFNPPRYVKLLEIIPLEETLDEVKRQIEWFGEIRLGKGIVRCKDTPNFIGNRIGSVTGAYAMDFILENNYTVAEVDAITGPLIGRPKTATFRLLDLVGLDVVSHVRKNLADAVPDDKFAQKYLNSDRANRLTDEMIEQGWLGGKSGQGFYKMVRENGKKSFWPLDLEALEYQPSEKVRFESVSEAKDLESLKDRLEFMLRAEDRAGDLVRALLYSSLAYASDCIPEIADTPKPIDDAMRWGFSNEAGPFETWDLLGVAETINGMRAAGFEPAGWVEDMLAAGSPTFYDYRGDQRIGVFEKQSREVSPLTFSSLDVSLTALKNEKKIIAENSGATLIDLGDGVGCVEFHTKMNVLDEDTGGMLAIGLERLETDLDGLVIGNQADHFSAGANLMLIVLHAQAGQWEDLRAIIKGLQDLHLAFRYSPKPIVVAPFGLTLGGGAEMMMHASRVVAAAELYTGLVEVGMGLIPAGGGTKEMMRRILNPAMRTDNTTDLPFLQRIFEQVGQAKVATSAVEARNFSMLGSVDRIVMNGDHLIAEAKKEVLHMVSSGYQPPVPEKIYAAGREGLAALRVGLFTFREGGYITEYENIIGGHLIRILSGGELSAAGWVDENYILELEREAFLSLCGEERTQERIWHFLQTGKPLRN